MITIPTPPDILADNDPDADNDDANDVEDDPVPGSLFLTQTSKLKADLDQRKAV
jgi:hypothetical protein